MKADIKFRLRGLMTEKFMQRALMDGIALSNVTRPSPRELYFESSKRDAKRLVILAETHRQDLTIIGTRGLTSIAGRLMKRPSLPVAVALALALTWLCLSRLWIIELPPGAPDSLSIELSNMGVRPGVRLSSIDTRHIENMLYVALGDCAFVGARIDGVRLRIKTVKELPEPELYDPTGSRDLVAGSDAIIVSVDALAGVSAVKPGDVVRRGQLLIRGEEKVSDELTRGVCALGAAVGRSWVSAEAEGSTSYAQLEPTGAISLESELSCLGFSIPLAVGDGFDSERTETEVLPVGGLYIPLVIRRTAHIETAPVDRTIDPDQLQAQLVAESTRKAMSNVPPGAEIVDKWTDYSMIEGDIMRARAVIEIRRNIAVGRSALTMGGN